MRLSLAAALTINGNMQVGSLVHCLEIKDGALHPFSSR